jgi:hypothetical protein
MLSKRDDRQTKKIGFRLNLHIWVEAVRHCVEHPLFLCPKERFSLEFQVAIKNRTPQYILVLGLKKFKIERYEYQIRRNIKLKTSKFKLFPKTSNSQLQTNLPLCPVIEKNYSHLFLWQNTSSLRAALHLH